MKGTRIIVTGPMARRGVFEDIFVSGTPKPGTVMELLVTAPVQNKFTYGVYGVTGASSGQGVSNDGDRKAIAILVEKDDEAKTFDDAYVTGDQGRVYFPAMGETFNMLIEDVAGTGDDFAVAEELMVDNGTGKLLTADSDAEAHPFTCLETVTNPLADHHTWCRFNGEGGA